MPRISGVEIPNQKRGVIALTYLFGIGKSLSKKILDEIKIDINKKAGDWTDSEQKKVREIVNQDYSIEGDLRTKILLDIKRLKDINSYRGIRHRMRLPVRGQNTKNNARTRKGARATIASKRKKTNK